MKNSIKDQIIPNTIMFLISTVFILLFTNFFGKANSLIGVSSFILMLMFMTMDLTGNLLKNTFMFIFINLATGIGVFLVGLNIWLAIPINFSLIFFLGYKFCQDLRRPVYVPFMLQYLFLIGAPVTFKEEPKRLLALVVGALIIMVPQLIFNLKKMEKQSNKMYKAMVELLQEKITAIKDDNDIQEIDEKLENLFNSFKVLILDRKEKNYEISKKGEINLNLLIYLEKINIALYKEKIVNKDALMFSELCLIEFLKILNKNITAENFKNQIYKNIENYKSRFNDLTSIELVNSFKMLANIISKDYSKENAIIEIKKKFNLVEFIKENKDTVAFSYATRAAIGITITCFITQLLQLKEGEWMMFTIYSLVNPIYEVSKYKSRDRVISTFLGVIVVIILSTIFKTQTEKSLLLLVVGYIMCYAKAYKYMIFFCTILIVSVAAGNGSVVDFALQRFIYVIIGLFIALILNKYVLRKDLKKVNESLKKKYENIIIEMLNLIYKMAKDKKLNKGKIQNLFLTTALIENKIKDNCNISLVNFNEEIDLKNRILAIDVFNLYTELENNINDDKYVSFLVSMLENLKSKNYKDNDTKKFNKFLEDLDKIEEKIICSNIYQIGSFDFKNFLIYK
ncbi:FUSC family protein [Clostridium thermobutyricum]